MAIKVEPSRKRFTADEFERMSAAGIFREEDRVELIDGEIVEMSPVGPGHAACVANLTKKLIIGVGDWAIVWIQSGAKVALESLPQPDLALLRPRSYRHENPMPADILLIVEVADSSLRYDRTRKLDVYATARIPEYWVVSVEDRWVEVYRSPEGHGYRESRRLHGADTIAPLAFPDVVIPLPDIFA
jgi:Uma2 family endonuclease